MTNEELIEQIHKGVYPSEYMGKLYEQNKGIICKIAKRYTSRADIEDLMQEAYLGLYEAVKHYENDSEVKFITYATYWIRQAMQRYIENNGNTIRIPVAIQQLYFRYSNVVKEYTERYNNVPSDRKIASILNESDKNIKYMKSIMYKAGSIESLDISVNGNDSEILRYETIIGSNGIENDIIDRFIDRDKKISLWDIVEDNTTDKENLVIVNRYKCKKTREDIGNIIGVSGERVRQIEVAALRKLRSPRIKRMLAERYEVAIQGAYRGTVGNFKNTWTSSTERTAIKLMKWGGEIDA